MILVLGKYGQVATELGLIASDDFIFTSRNEIDLLKPEKIENDLTNFSPRLIINCTAFNNVDDAEKNPIDAFLINSESIKKLAEYSKHSNCPVIHISTDFVFDGSDTIYDESAKKNPLNNYGISKSDGEDHLFSIASKFMILRTSWVYSSIGNNFLNNIRNSFFQNKEIYGAKDVYGSPTRAYTIARFINDNYKNFLESDFKKIYHICDNGSTSKLDFIQQILIDLAEKNEISNPQVHKVTNDFFNLPAKRPMYSSLDNRNLQKDFNFKINDWKYELKEEIMGSVE